MRRSTSRGGESVLASRRLAKRGGIPHHTGLGKGPLFLLYCLSARTVRGYADPTLDRLLDNLVMLRPMKICFCFPSLRNILAGLKASSARCLVAVLSLCGVHVVGQEYQLHSFSSIQLTDTYFSEGANAGDLNNDGHPDVVYGPYWFAGPTFQDRHELYEPVPQPVQRYADNFFSWIHDFNNDGWNDVFVVGFPGTPAHVYENPGGTVSDRHWTKYEVFDSVGNESPQFTNIVGDERPELVCAHHGVFGFATINWNKPREQWAFHPVSGRITAMKFGHGLGIGDINGDELFDIIHPGGWFEQPDSSPKEELWIHHEVTFSNSYGGAEMFAYDVDGDGDSDVITSHAAHDFGLAWYEQQLDGNGERVFHEHLIMGYRPDQNRYGLVFSEPHSVNLVDMDGDGLRDIVTGKTYYSHHQKSPLWDAGAVAYWFRLTREASGVDWVPYLVAEDTGIGRQISVLDLNADQLPDIIVGGMKGSHVMLQQSSTVSKQEWLAAQPKVYESSQNKTLPVQAVSMDGKTGLAAFAIEAESMKVIGTPKGKVSIQDMSGFKGNKWSAGKQLFWAGATPRARLELQFEVVDGGVYELGARFTTAKDYAIINVLLDDRALTEPIDLFGYPAVSATGVVGFGKQTLESGPHRLTLETIGKNPAATKSYMVGMDFFQLIPVAK